jgi:hypothetical protein
MKVNGQLHAPAALFPGKECPLLIGQETREPEPVWTLWREKNPGYSACSSSLYRLSYPDSSRYLERRKTANKEKTRCRLVRSYYVSDEYAASTFREGLKMRTFVFCENFVTLPKYAVPPTQKILGW